MSWILFSRSSKVISLFSGDNVGAITSPLIGSWQAHNNVASNANGVWPSGVYKWSHYKDHAYDQEGFGPGCFATKYGCRGIHVFSVLGRSGLGIHAGRATVDALTNEVLGKVTMGCIRTSEIAMETINNTHNQNSIKGIVVAD